MFEPRRPLHRDTPGSLPCPPLVLRVPPNSPIVTVGPLASRVSVAPAPATPLWQLDGADNLAMQPDSEGAGAANLPGPSGITGIAAPDQHLPPLPDSDSEVPHPVSFFVWGKYYLLRAFKYYAV